MDSDRARIDESALRDEIVEVGRAMRSSGLVVATEGNLSARLSDGLILATPAGADKGRLSPDDFVLVDAGGGVLGRGRASTEIDMHLAIYAVRDDIRAICHGHPPHATAFAAAHRALDACLLPEVVSTLGYVPLSEYGTPSTPEVAAAIAPLFADHDAALLRNHGVVVAGRTPTEAFGRLETVERLAQITYLAEALGGAKALTREQVDGLLAVRGVYGPVRPVPGCRVSDD